MTDLNYNEIATLRHHADGNQKVGIPEGLTPSQYYTAARSLRDKGLVYAGFIEGGELEAIKIKHEGQAVVDDMLRDEKRILRGILFGYDLTLDQYDLLNYIKKNGTSMGHSKHMGIENWREYYYSIPAPIAEKGLITFPENDDDFIFTHKGKQVLEDIKDDLNEELAKLYNRNEDFALRVSVEPQQEKVEQRDKRPSAKQYMAILKLFNLERETQHESALLLSLISGLSPTTFNNLWSDFTTEEASCEKAIATMKEKYENLKAEYPMK